MSGLQAIQSHNSIIIIIFQGSKWLYCFLGANRQRVSQQTSKVLQSKAKHMELFTI